MSPTTTIASELAELNTNSLPTKITAYPVDGVGLLLYLIIQVRYLAPSLGQSPPLNRSWLS